MRRTYQASHLPAAPRWIRRRLTDEQGAVRRHVNIYLGNDNIRDLDGLGTTLRDGDELLVLPSVAGG